MGEVVDNSCVIVSCVSMRTVGKVVDKSRVMASCVLMQYYGC